MKVLLLFQGGGSLGAFGCGAWLALSERMREAGAELVGVAGASIGAINSALIARHHGTPDWGAGLLEAFWRERLATPSFPFLGPADVWPLSAAVPGGSVRSWNGVLTGLLLGNRALYRSIPAHWTPYAALHRARMPLLDRSRMLQTLQEAFGRYGGPGHDGPWLAVPAVDLEAGELRLFGSDRESIEPLHLAASSAVPLLFEPVEIDGRLYWDGDMIRHSMVPLALEQLKASGRLDDDADLLIISIEQMPRRSAVPPVAGLELATRMLELMQQDKFAGPNQDPATRPRLLQIHREALPHDTISSHYDYSPERIDELIHQGRRMAEQAWQAGPATRPADPAQPPAARGRAPERKAAARAPAPRM
ncbi:patatin-like phospholipase family protein [Eleftheria terrae]|uniref:patatin-like phospholipase family protein n=1 Tax=Eleftheria terrae TaxID=1597781 RepID=UPI00263BC22F|nr:patatin-like phospholipase family protein [Eleftheria terrae]WKB52100.1 patatin-like phospholipase family protein [Eleftheria terrae]